MDLRAKRGKWEYRFQFEGIRVTKVTGLEATQPNRKKAEKLAALHRDELLKGVQDAKEPKHRLFVEACAEFEAFLGVEHHNKPNRKHRSLSDVARLILNQGMRPDEVMTLQKTHLDIEKRRIHIHQGKTKAAGEPSDSRRKASRS